MDKDPNKRVSLQQIADALGVTKMTVSLALRDHPRISASTKQRIRTLANDLGYRPNPEVARLMSAIRKEMPDQRGLPLGYVTTGRDRGFWRTSPTERDYWVGACERAAQYGYYIEEFWLDEPHMTQRRMSQILQHRGIRGLIIPPFNCTLNEHNRNQRLAFDWDQFAAVSIGDMLVDPPIHRVIHDHYASILTTMERLLGLGYRRIGLCLTRHMDFTVNQRWQAGYRVYRANHPLERIEPLILPDLSADAVLRWIRSHQLDAIVSAELRMPRFLEEVGLHPGKDIAFADLDLDPSLPQHRSMSGIIQNSKVLGMAAVDLVVSALNRNQLGIPEVPFVLQVEGIWSQMASTPARCIT